jgi:antitoxin YefM
MKSIRIVSDITPPGEFKAGISSCLKKVQATGHPLINTRNGRPAGVLLSPVEYDNLVYRRQFIESVEQGKVWRQQNPGKCIVLRRSGRCLLKKIFRKAK